MLYLFTGNNHNICVCPVSETEYRRILKYIIININGSAIKTFSKMSIYSFFECYTKFEFEIESFEYSHYVCH